jgi:hypothetical protein
MGDLTVKMVRESSENWVKNVFENMMTGGVWTMGRESQLWGEMEGGRSFFEYQTNIW